MNKISSIKKRNGEITSFELSKIESAIKKAFLKITGEEHENIATHISELVLKELELEYMVKGEDYVTSVEHVQDLVEKHIMAAGFYNVAKEYIIYRYEHTKLREEVKKENAELAEEGGISVIKRDGRKEKFNVKKIEKLLDVVASDYINIIGADTFKTQKLEILEQIKLEVFDGMKTKDVYKIFIMNLRVMIESDPAYSKVAAKLVLYRLYDEVLGGDKDYKNIDQKIQSHFPKYIKDMVTSGKFDERMSDFDLEELSKYLVNDRDSLFEYMGIEILISRYLLSDMFSNANIETPQMFWMRIAMGTALNEPKDKKMETVKNFYDIMSKFYYTPGGRTLYQSGTKKAQVSNCFVNEVQDDLREIFRTYSDNAQLLKWSGGVGTSWTKVRATGALVKSVEITSQGVIPYLKIANDINVCVMRSGKRRAAAVVYLESWHIDIEDFLEARKNTGDERRRLHDIDTANWIPDLFMKRVRQDSDWTMFSPDEVPELNDIYGKEFEAKYAEYEAKADRGEVRVWKRIKAKDLWKKMLVMLFETGHPWITFKDPSNIRNPQDHVGVIHSSNLCTEIMLNTSKDETAVCTLGSINVEKFITEDKKIDDKTLEEVVSSSIRMLDNIIDINYYPTEDSARSNKRHRPVGLGLRGYHDALYKMDILFDSEKAVEFSDIFMEKMSYYAINASALLAKEKGAYETFKGSKWDRNIFPIDTLKLLEEERGEPVNVDRESRMDWTSVRDNVKKYGMRNSNTMAIAPTASTANLVGCIPTIEPIYKNIYVKSNKEGEFTVVNKYLVQDLKNLGLWSKDMLTMIKFHSGSIQKIFEIPSEVRDKYKEVFDIDQRWLLQAAAVRSKWIDQSQSINMFFKGASGKDLNDLYMYAWELGLKTTYYLRTLGASQVEKSTVQVAGATTHNQRSSSSTNNMNEKISPATTIAEEVVVVNIPAASATVVNNEIVNTNNVASSLKVKPVYNIYRADEGEACEGCSA
ncbi:MAG: ribonucleoside-diphosphate reductase alpha chain [Patescibacteria group bacterium]|nr:ribonucleoside-diphosphate reductase alpha chain [Patescibacteria group bacterium]